MVTGQLADKPTRAPGQHTAKRQKVHETITFLLVTFPNIYRFKKIHLQTQQ